MFDRDRTSSVAPIFLKKTLNSGAPDALIFS